MHATTTEAPAARRATLTITSYSFDPMATEADFDAWVSYVSSRIDERTGLDVTVESTRFERPEVFEDVIRAARWADQDDAEQTIGDALTSLWEEFCAAGWPSATSEVAS